MELNDLELERVAAGKAFARAADRLTRSAEDTLASLRDAADAHRRAADSIGRIFAPPANVP
jgi:hypothetical protein